LCDCCFFVFCLLPPRLRGILRWLTGSVINSTFLSSIWREPLILYKSRVWLRRRLRYIGPLLTQDKLCWTN
jgi:hypothetical protein